MAKRRKAASSGSAGALVVVPSYGRAGRVSTVDVFPGGVIVVPEKQADSYRALQAFPDGWEVVAISDEDDGNIARKRNTILRLFAGRDIVMVDDDYDYLGRWQDGIDVHQSKEDITAMLEQGFRMCRELGGPLWGINLQTDSKFYRVMAPFSMTNVVLGPFLALTAERPAWLQFDEDLWLKEDYDFALRVLQHWHRILRFGQFHYMVDHFNETGGLVGKRNMSEEVRQLHALQRRWGSDVVKIELHRSVNPRISVPIKGI